MIPNKHTAPLLRCCIRPNGRRRDSRISGRASGGKSRDVELTKNAPRFSRAFVGAGRRMRRRECPNSARPQLRLRAERAIEMQGAVAVRCHHEHDRTNARSVGNQSAPAVPAAPEQTSSIRERSKRISRSNRHRRWNFVPEPAAMIARTPRHAARTSSRAICREDEDRSDEHGRTQARSAASEPPRPAAHRAAYGDERSSFHPHLTPQTTC
jgi:hypothetical protein